MTQSDIKITNAIIMKYCKREQKFQALVYSKKIAAGKMSKFEANKNYLIIKGFHDLAKTLDAKGYKWSEIQNILDNLPNQKGKRRVQGSLFKPSNFQK